MKIMPPQNSALDSRITRIRAQFGLQIEQIPSSRLHARAVFTVVFGAICTIVKLINRKKSQARHLERIDRLVTRLDENDIPKNTEETEGKAYPFPSVSEIAEKIKQNMAAEITATQRAAKRKNTDLPSAKLFSPPSEQEDTLKPSPRRHYKYVRRWQTASQKFSGQ